MSNEKIEHDFNKEVYAVLNSDGDDMYYNVCDDKVDAVQGAEDQPTLLATYKLVKVERVQIVSEVKVVAA